MSIDFSGLCLAPQMAIFGKQATITPEQSNPNGAAYTAIGIFTINAIDIPTDGGGFMTSTTIKFGIRLADYVYPPKQGDIFSTPVSNLPVGYWQGWANPTTNLDFRVDDVRPDGQGGATLLLMRLNS